MMKAYDIAVLRPDQAARAYVLMQLAAPSLDFETWKTVAADGVRRSKFLAVTDARGCVRGICVLCTRNHPIAGQLMDIPIFVVASTVGENDIAEDLFAAARDRAVAANCSSLRVWGFAPENWQRLADDDFINRWDHGLMYWLDS